MIINGEKFACEICIRGHRVAQCQHNDRPLQQVSKKGRPVSQCSHCRSLRKSRSLHTNCKCGSRSGHATLKQSGAERCRCCKGETCTCAYKSEATGDAPKIKPKARGMGSSSPFGDSQQRTPEADQNTISSDLTCSSEPCNRGLEDDSLNTVPSIINSDDWPLDSLLDLWASPLDESLASHDALEMSDWTEDWNLIPDKELQEMATNTQTFDTLQSSMDPCCLDALSGGLPAAELLGTECHQALANGDWDSLSFANDNNQEEWLNHP
ncbi:hypothetical protein FZEAL_2674 [Fusarium zealandicum]|uniref:Copper-fist domain-containing protein n=1 Tax=Fusarium zealandicum TaxID=1053134 RepID=A0A8H4XNC8_9HYPO|nr:hypothetical protein FZEAL_2674 [Fusarium zealandicum]